MDKRHNLQERLEVARMFIKMMTDSGYDTNTRGEVVRSAVRKFYREMDVAKEAGNSIYRTRQEIEKKKELSRLLNRPWY